MQWKKKFTRLKAATGHSRARRMLCCGRRKENGRSVPDVTASPGRAPPGPLPSNQMQQMGGQQQPRQQGVKEPVLLQGDFRKVSGISSEIFRQIEAVENDHDPNTAAALEAVERRGEMIVRILEPRSIGGKHAVEAAHKLMAKGDARHTVQLVEIVKRPGQTLGLYIREGNGADRTDGVFISRIALESAVYNSGCLRVGDEILAVNLVDVTHMSLDDVVIIMSIPRRLVLAIRQRRGARGTSSPGPPTLSRPEQKPPPVVVIKRDLRDEDLDDADRMPRSRSSRERRDGREMTESRSRLGLGLNNYSPQSEQLDLYYNTRANVMQEPPSWGYKPPPPPSVITEQPKSHSFAPSSAYYQNAGTLESLAEKVHSFYPGPSRRMSAGAGVTLAQQHARFPRSGSDQHLPRVEYSDYSSSLGRHSLLRSSLKPGALTSAGGTLGRYGRYEPQSRSSKYGVPPSAASQSLTRRSRPSIDYSSDTEATIGQRPSYYYYNRPAIGSIPRGTTTGILGGNVAPDLAKFNSLPRERPGVRMSGIRPRISDRIMDDADGNLSAPEFTGRRDMRERDLRSRITASPSIFTSDEYRAWLRRAPSSSAIAEQMRLTRDLLSQPRSHRFSCSAENIHDALKNTESIYSSRTGVLTGTLDRHLGMPRPISSLPVRSMSSQHIGGPSSIRSPSIRRMRQLLELSTGPASPSGSILSGGGHQSPAPTPSATLPRSHRQIDINPAEFAKYKLDKPIMDVGGVSGMLWIHLLAGRGLRTAPEINQPGAPQAQSRDLYCVLECDRVHKARTVVRSGDLQFDWDESFELDLVCNKQLDVLVYSWDPQHRHKLCYRGAISLASLLRQSPLHQLALKVEPRGTIYIRLRHTDPITLYKRRGLPSLRAGYPQLFGADLETVVSRESKGAPGSAPVPIVLRRCVEEVERRGLDIIGLYRLCGSATKKRLLREAFERNSRAVELSPEHVPDINVITGVLKDYLRELPEPLFTRCLFQMTVDALAVCLPDDPEGNAKLMLSILDCLPRANRATLVFLLDHLSLVVSASERNKMSAQALATVMGPPLMLHSSSAPPGSDIDHAQPIAVLKYLLQIWPQPQIGGSGMGSLSAVGVSAIVGPSSGRRGESTGQRGSKVNVLQADKHQLQQASLRPSISVTNILSQGQHHLSATASTHLYQSVVGQLAQSPRALQQAVQQPHQLAVSAGSAIQDQSQLPLPGTPSPGSSSASTGSGSGSGSGTDTIKRGASPASVKHVKIYESPSSYSISKNESQKTLTATTTTTPQTTSTKESNIDKTKSNVGNNGIHGPKSTSYSTTSSTAATTNNAPTSYSSSTSSSALETSYTPSSALSSARHKSSATSSSSSSATTVVGAGSTTSGATTSSDDSDDLISYKSSASTNALLAQSQAMTTTQLMSKYLKREPRVTFTPIKSPTTPSPPSGSSTVPSQDKTSTGDKTDSSGFYSTRGSYQLSSSLKTTSGGDDSTGLASKYHSPSSPSSASGLTSYSGTKYGYTSASDSVSPSSSSTYSKASSPSKPTSSALNNLSSSGSGTASSTSSSTSLGRSYLYQTSDTPPKTSSNNYSSNLVSKQQQQQQYTASPDRNQYQQQVSSSASGIPSYSSSNVFSSNGSNALLYGTLPKHTPGSNGGGGNGGGSGNGSNSSSTAAMLSSTTSSYLSDSIGTTASSSGVSSMAGSASSYDFYTNPSNTRAFGSSSAAATGNGGSSGNYHTLGSYRVQYSSTNPFLEAFDPAPSATTTASSSSSTSVSHHSHASNNDRSSIMLSNFHSDSKNGDEYDDLK
ncbi:rho GTPase-activating protein 100F isoform X2 [Episyrphus balteatus]|uniref:rho GTPase-activating protein 100F isoform X2 n=1 Tax=Episyrphus balteatus TaxID=286459 RepID=UPI002485BC4E|nr:rho GTPase-activating protein 100F isoform X2 [Episyrphus balteatus]